MTRDERRFDSSGRSASRPFSDRPEGRELAHRLASGGGIRVAELDGQPVGVLVLGSAPDYVPPSAVPETYITLVLTSRVRTGQRIGAQLIERAVEEAHAAGHEQLRVDCWADAPSLVAWYESQGFAPSGTFERDGWIGQVLSRPLLDQTASRGSAGSSDRFATIVQCRGSAASTGS